MLPFFVPLIMLNPLFDKCSECSAEGNNSKQLIVNKKYKLCQRHNRIRLDLEGGVKVKSSGRIKYSRFSDTFDYCTRWGFKKEMDMYIWIWNERYHVSWFTGFPITAFNPAIFMHVLPKGLNKFPHYRLNPDNIVLGSREEHDLVDQGTQEQRNRYKKKFPQFSMDEWYLKESHLREEYRKEFDK